MSITAPEGSVQSTFAGREILACARVRAEERGGYRDGGPCTDQALVSIAMGMGEWGPRPDRAPIFREGT